MVNLEGRFMIRDMDGNGMSIRAIAGEGGRDGKTMRKISQAGPSGAGDQPAHRRGKKGVKLASLEGDVKPRRAEGVLKTRKRLRELKARGYQGGLTPLILYGQPYRTAREERAVMRDETEPGQVLRLVEDTESIRIRARASLSLQTFETCVYQSRRSRQEGEKSLCSRQ